MAQWNEKKKKTHTHTYIIKNYHHHRRCDDDDEMFMIFVYSVKVVVLYIKHGINWQVKMLFGYAYQIYDHHTRLHTHANSYTIHPKKKTVCACVFVPYISTTTIISIINGFNHSELQTMFAIIHHFHHSLNIYLIFNQNTLLHIHKIYTGRS